MTTRRHFVRFKGEKFEDAHGELNTTMPVWPEGEGRRKLPFWRKVMCLLGYHRWADWFQDEVTMEGIKEDVNTTRLRDKCFFCDAGRP